MTRGGFEPPPMKTTALTLRLRPLGHRVMIISVVYSDNIEQFNENHIFQVSNSVSKHTNKVKEKMDQSRAFPFLFGTLSHT